MKNQPFLFRMAAALLFSSIASANAQTTAILFEDVRVFDSKAAVLSTSTNVCVEGNTIKAIRSAPIAPPAGATVLRGGGCTLMLGLTNAHLRLVSGSMTMEEMMAPDLKEKVIFQKAAAEAEAMLMCGFTAARDVGGPIFPAKMAIDQGKIKGPRVWPSGAVISQTAGHGDYRTPNERSRRFFGQPARAELYGATFIAEGTAEVLAAVRENLRFDASQIKLVAGGGTSSDYDPVDVTQYTFDEMRAAVEAAEDWGTYVMVHAYTPRAIRKAVDAGVKCIEHGQLLDEKPLRYLAKKGVWLSL